MPATEGLLVPGGQGVHDDWPERWMKMSTAELLTPPACAHRISIHLQHIKARLLPRNTSPPPTPTSRHLAISTTQNKKKYVPIVWPPANMANPWFGSDVAAREPLTTLRAAVVQRPLVELKMSTALLKLLSAHAHRISTSKRASFHATQAPPRLPHHAISQYQQLKTK